jgi:hypothetical protein
LGSPCPSRAGHMNPGSRKCPSPGTAGAMTFARAGGGFPSRARRGSPREPALMLQYGLLKCPGWGAARGSRPGGSDHVSLGYRGGPFRVLAGGLAGSSKSRKRRALDQAGVITFVQANVIPPPGPWPGRREIGMPEVPLPGPGGGDLVCTGWRLLPFTGQAGAVALARSNVTFPSTAPVGWVGDGGEPRSPAEQLAYSTHVQ